MLLSKPRGIKISLSFERDLHLSFVFLKIYFQPFFYIFSLISLGFDKSIKVILLYRCTTPNHNTKILPIFSLLLMSLFHREFGNSSAAIMQNISVFQLKMIGTKQFENGPVHTVNCNTDTGRDREKSAGTGKNSIGTGRCCVPAPIFLSIGTNRASTVLFVEADMHAGSIDIIRQEHRLNFYWQTPRNFLPVPFISVCHSKYRYMNSRQRPVEF